MLNIHNLSVRLEERQILDQIQLQLTPHHLTALVGKNGSGKSTLLSCINQQIPYKGKIAEGEQDLAALSPKKRAKAIAILPQTLPGPHITAEEMVSFGRNPYLDFTGRMTDYDRKIVQEALQKADAAELSQRYVDTLSGGERQRVALAMVLAQDTPIILLDEPTSHMDQRYEASFLQILSGLTQEGKTVLIVLHDLATAVEYADELAVLDEGRLAFFGTKEQCLREEILEKTFGVTRYTAKCKDGVKIFFGAK